MPRKKRAFFTGCFHQECDLDGKYVWPETEIVDGKACLVRYPTEILQADQLQVRLQEIRDDEDNIWDDDDAEYEAMLLPLIEVAGR